MTAIVAGATSTITARDQRERAHASELLARLHDIVGAERLITTDDARRLRALDFSEEPGVVPLAVIEPVSTDEVARIVAAAAEHATALVVRGGGMSYTRAHLAAAEPTVMIDI